jgi:hypothetical protein
MILPMTQNQLVEYHSGRSILLQLALHQVYYFQYLADIIARIPAGDPKVLTKAERF